MRQPGQPPVLASTPSTLLTRLADGEQRAALTFAGQGAEPLPELRALLSQRPELKAAVALAADVMGEIAASPVGSASGMYRFGTDLGAWLELPDVAPPEPYLRSSAISHPLILLTQAALWRALSADGLTGDPVAATGHSQGLWAALMVAEAPGGVVDDEILGRYLRLACMQGLHAATAARRGVAGELTPMAAISGIRLERLRPLLDELNAELGDHDAGLSVALVNTRTRIVISGPPAALGLLRARLARQAGEEREQRRRGQRGGAPLRFSWAPLAVDVPFHSPALEAALTSQLAWLRAEAPLPAPSDLRLPVLCPATGSDLRDSGDLAAVVARGHFVDPVRWDLVGERLADCGTDWVLDLGPGTDVAQLTAGNLRGSGVRALGLASPDGRRVLTTPGAAPSGPDIRYADFAPGVIALPGGRRHVDTRYTRLAGRSPVILAGMTPTTADADIVAAAANAGYHAELAGGGQPDRETFESRVQELRELLDPGVEVVFNTLLLDRHLWTLHWTKEALLPAARAAGAPFAGLTVSAGIPEVDEGIALLDRLAAAGMMLNAFKPGTVDQVRQVLAIADAAPHHTICVQLEGGHGGGHHSWEDLDELLLDCYYDLRRRPNVIVLAGGGIDSPERVGELLTGRWSHRHRERSMPIDGVLLGTVAMACAEAAASPQVKAALVAAPGSSGWVPRGTVAGGVTSSRSNLGADIHLLDNDAARAAHLVEALAGDAGAVAARRDELVEALARTAKPYFGDLDDLTYGGLLDRFTRACAIGSGGRYDDGAWGHRSWRARALMLYRRFAARLDAVDDGMVEPPVATVRDLDDPDGALRAFADAYPGAATTLLHPADAHFFLEVCAREGKPVPFVPVLDADIRRWFMADGLWQAQDERLAVDGVFVIPGPRAVAGIERANEPIVELLERFEAHALETLEAAGAPLATRDRLVGAGAARPPLAGLIASSRGMVAAFCATPSVVDEHGDARLNPLWRLAAPGDEADSERGADGALRSLETRPPGPSTAERVLVEAHGDEVLVSAFVARLDGAGEPLQLRFVPLPNGRGFRELSGEASRAGFAAAQMRNGGPPPPTDPLEPIDEPWHCEPGLARAYRAATGATHEAPPPELALTLAWPALSRLLTSPALAAHLSELVHAEHEFEPTAAWPPQADERGRARARVELIEDPVGAPTRVVCHAELSGDRGVLAQIKTTLAILDDAPIGDHDLRIARELDVELQLPDAATIDILAAQPWLSLTSPAPLSVGDRVRVRGTVGGERARDGRTRWWASGSMRAADHGEEHALGEIALDHEGDEVEHPVVALLGVLADPDPVRQPRPRLPLAALDETAPADMTAFAHIGGDRNPLHRSLLAARLAGLERPIVHGAWTAARASAFVIDELCDGRADALRHWSVRFLAPVPLGALLDFSAARVGVEDGLLVVEVDVRMGDATVAIGEALVAPPPTAVVFPGQGVQRKGLGTDGRERSAAARATWARADACTRDRLGFSLLDVVERNPTELTLADGSTRRHPTGVLFRTEFTQVALVALAAAQLAELRAAGVLGTEGFVAAGHSVGEFSALVALGVLPLEAALELVHRRGLVMQACVARDKHGASVYRLAAIDPSAAGISLPELTTLVATIAAECGDPLEIVNHNALGRQYAVAGTTRSIDELRRLLPRNGPADAGVQVLSGIDVPFHSSVLAPAVAGLRADLEALVPRIDHRRLVGRWVPNLLGRPFSLDADFVAAALGGASPELVSGTPDDAARTLAIELLARQLAAPVRWVETQIALAAPAAANGLGARRVVELGPTHAPVLTRLAGITYAAAELGVTAPELRQVEVDRERVLELDEPPATVDAAEVTPPATDTRPHREATPPATAARGSDAPAPSTDRPAPLGDRPVDAGVALRLVLAVQARLRVEQLRDDETIDECFQGVSSRRNQVMIDLGREFGLTGADDAHEQPIGTLANALSEHGGRYRFPGPYLRDTVTTGLTRALGRSGLSRSDAVAHLAAAWDLGPGLADHVLATLALESRPGASARGGPLGRLAGDPPTTAAGGRGLIDRAAELAAPQLGIGPRSAAASAPAPAADPELVRAATARVEHALLDAARALTEGLDGGARRDGGSAPGADPLADPLADRLALLDAELGEGAAAALAPRLDHRRHVQLASSWAAARWDLVDCFHAALDGRLAGERLEAEVARLALHGKEPAIAATASWLAGAAAERDRADLAALLRTIPAGARTPLPVRGTRPVTTLGPRGEAIAGSEPDPTRPLDLANAFANAEATTGAGAGAPLSRPDTAVADALARSLTDALAATPDLRAETALVTGASPGSIGIELVRRLLRGGAKVIVTTSNDSPERRRWYREVYREASAPGAELHLLPANLAAFADVDALVEWLHAPRTERRGRPDLRPDPLAPTLVAPFAAMPTAGDAGSDGGRAEVALRLQLLGVQRLIAGLAARHVDGRPLTVLLPLSPNHGAFGGDGVYGETKAGLEVMLRRWRSERAGWGSRVSLVAPRIGWVRGTGLMGVNDALASLVEERLGVRTFGADEMGWLLCALATEPVRRHARDAPVELDLTGGLGAVDDLRAGLEPLIEQLRAGAERLRRRDDLEGALAGRLHPGGASDAKRSGLPALPAPHTDAAASATAGDPVAGSAATVPALAELVVIVGTGELGPGGSGRTRFELELDGSLSPAAIAELAWLCGLVSYQSNRRDGRWIDAASGDEVPEEELPRRYRDAVAARVGLRRLEDDGVIDPAGMTTLTAVALDRELSFEAASREEAEGLRAVDPERTRIERDPDSDVWRVTVAPGAQVRVERRVAHSRRVAGQLPTGLDLARLGVPDDLLASADRMGLVNLACVAEAFREAGLEPEELLTAVHPALVANTQGAGMGGMSSLRRLLLDRLLGGERQGDRLQESLGNVVAAHAVQSYIGSYGPMVHPVAACATAAVSLEEAHDKIRAGKALAVIAGGYDDLTPEGIDGFGDMGATADSADLEAMGLAPAETSRANDVRRRGFVESQGGGALLVVRGDIALELGLPVRGVVAYAGSFGDGIQTSIPAPGMGVLACALGGPESPLAKGLARLGLGADDIAIVSKHDTSTELNDPNEADLHERIQDALGRTPGNPLLVVSQKTVTGHAKGGTAAWQVDGVLRMMERGLVPGNRNLESADPLLRDGRHLTLGDRTLKLADGERIDAALVTSLGFGHVSALLALVHPDHFLAAVPADARADYLRRANVRRAAGERARLALRVGPPASLRRSGRRLGASTDARVGREREAAVLLDPAARMRDGELR